MSRIAKVDRQLMRTGVQNQCKGLDIPSLNKFSEAHWNVGLKKMLE
jgi:hypothetical protein